MTANVSATGSCFHIVNDTITLDCGGFRITYASTADGTAINNTGGYDNIIIQNCDIRESTGRVNTPGITFRHVSNSTIEFSKIVTLGTFAPGIILEDSDNNTIRSNNITTLISVTARFSVGVFFNQSIGSSTNDHNFSSSNFIINNNFTVQNYSLLFYNYSAAILQGSNNTLSYNNSFGSINWTRTNLTTSLNLSVGTNIFIQKNVVGIADLNSSVDLDRPFNLNTSARIEIKNLTFPGNRTPFLVKVSFDPGAGQTNYVRCDNSSQSISKCNITYDNVLGILYANVTSFSNYTADLNNTPVLSQLVLNTTNLSSNRTEVNVTAYNTSDLAPKIIYNWRRNGTTITLLNMPFEGINGSTTNNAWDYSGYGNNGSLQGSVDWISNGGYDKRGAYNFTNADNHGINISFSPGTLDVNQTTYAVWINITDITANYLGVITKGDISGIRPFSIFTIGENVEVWYSIAGGSAARLTAFDVLEANKYRHIVATYAKNGNLSIYVNGTLNASTIEPYGPQINTTHPLHIGFRRQDFPQTFSGAIDDILIFNFSLTPDQVFALYQNNFTVITASETVKLENWSIEGTPNNGTYDGNMVTSNNVSILNTKPVISPLVLNTTNVSRNDTDLNLTAYANTSDADNESVKVIYNWLRNDSSITVLNMPFERINRTNFNNTWDYSGKGNHGNETNAILWNATAGYDGLGAYQFDGVNDYIDLADSPYFKSICNSGCSFSARVRSQALGNKAGDVIARWDNINDNFFRLVVSSARQASFSVDDDGTTPACTASSSAGALAGNDTFYFLTGLYNLTNTLLYIDGTAVGNTVCSFTSINAVAWQDVERAVIGAEDQGQTQWWNGTIDEVVVWNKSLSAEQVFALFQNKTNTTVAQETLARENWSVQATPNDGFEDGNMVLSNNVSIRDIIAPNVNITNPANASNFSARTVLFNASVTDRDSPVETVLFMFNTNATRFNKTATNSSGNWNTNVNLSDFPEGLHSAIVFANDSANNINQTVNVSFTVDRTAPNASFIVPANASNFSARTFGFNLSLLDNVTQIQTALLIFNTNATPFNKSLTNTSGNWSTTVNFSDFPEGLHTVVAYVNDSAGNLNQTVNISFTVDRTAPTVSTNNPTDGQAINGTATFNGIFNDNVTSVQVVIFQFSNGSGVAFNKTGTDTGALNIWQITEGLNTRSMMESQVHTVTYFANDSANNLNTTFTMTVTVDNTPPYVNIINPTNGSNLSGVTYNFNATIRNVSSDDIAFPGETRIDTVLFQFSNGTSPFNRSATNRSGTWNIALNLSTVLVEGTQLMTVFANDTVNNMNSTQTVNFIVDRTPPNVTTNFLNNPVDNSNFSIRSSNRTFNASIFDNLTLVDVVYFWFDNGTGKDFNITATNRSGQWSVSYNVSTLAEERQGVRIFANDSANNENSSFFVNFTADYTAPTVNFTSHAEGTNVAGRQVFNATVRDNLLEISTVIFQFSNGTSPFNRTAVNNSGSWNVSVETVTIGEGTMTITIFANDTVANMNNTHTLVVTIDNVLEGSTGGEAPTRKEAPTREAVPTREEAPTREAAPSVSETASASETETAFQTGEASTSVAFTGTVKTAAYGSEQSYKLSITNNLNKKLVLSGRLEVKEEEIPLENEENTIKRLKEELLLEGELDEAALERELSILKLLESVEVLQVYKSKLSHLLPPSLVGAAVAVPLQPTGKRIEANLLHDLLLNAEELQHIEVNPGETLEKEIKIRRGLRFDRKEPPKIIFTSGGEQVLIKDLQDHEELVTGTAVDVDPKTKTFDFYIIIPPQKDGGKEIFAVEMNINVKKSKVAAALPIKVKLPFFLSGDSETIFTELYGPYTVNLERGALLAVQYDASSIQGNYEVIGKVYKKGTELLAENHFEIKQ